MELKFLELVWFADHLATFNSTVALASLAAALIVGSSF